MPCRPSPQGGIMVTASRVLSVEQSGHVAILWLDNPERRNALGPEFWEDLPALMRQLSDDSAVRAIVIAAKGPHFTVGLDLKAFGGTLGGGEGSSEAARRTRLLGNIKRLQASITAVADCPKPVLAAVQGYCLGGGVDLITACDIRLVNDVLPDPTALAAATRELAGEIAANSPLAVQGTKAVLRACKGRSIAEGLDYVAVWNAAFVQSNDLGEAMAAFAEKRAPRFTGT